MMNYESFYFHSSLDGMGNGVDEQVSGQPARFLLFPFPFRL